MRQPQAQQRPVTTQLLLTLLRARATAEEGEEEPTANVNPTLQLLGHAESQLAAMEGSLQRLAQSSEDAQASVHVLQGSVPGAYTLTGPLAALASWMGVSIAALHRTQRCSPASALQAC